MMELYGKGKLGFGSLERESLFMVKGEREFARTCVPRSLPRKNVFSLSFIERPRVIQHGGVK